MTLMVCTLGVVTMCPTITNEKVNLYRKDGLSVPCDNSNTTTTILRTETIYQGGLKGSPFFCHTYSEELEWSEELE